MSASTSKRSPLIRDGVTFTARVPALPGVYDAFAVQYRPAIGERVDKYQKDAERDRTKAALELLKEHVVSLDLLDEHGVEIQPTTQVLKQLPHPVRGFLVDHICMYVSSGDAERDLGN